MYIENPQRTKKLAKMRMISAKIRKALKTKEPRNWLMEKDLRNFNQENESCGIMVKTSLVIFVTSLAPS